LAGGHESQPEKDLAELFGIWRRLNHSLTLLDLGMHLFRPTKGFPTAAFSGLDSKDALDLRNVGPNFLREQLCLRRITPESETVMRRGCCGLPAVV
jgi:hypothetical protein